ncbi:MAG: addiction module protein [Micrococcales bacterium]|nr:addiction module protein [Micrococcales bacterium]
MAAETDDITQAALALSERERAALAETLLDSLDAPSEVEAAWTDEIESRVDDILRGKVKTIPFAQIKAELAAHRAEELRSA